MHIAHKSDFPQVILNVEKVELGISAGLQDRVIQTYGGLVHMDFSGAAAASTGVCPYTPLDTSLLPEMYLAYDAHAGTRRVCFYVDHCSNV
jgi:glucuronokinase